MRRRCLECGKEDLLNLGGLCQDCFFKKTPNKDIADNINHPPHYKSHPSGIEPIDITRFENFNIGNVIKYCMRRNFKHANPIECLKKAQFYLNDEIKKLESEKP